MTINKQNMNSLKELHKMWLMGFWTRKRNALSITQKQITISPWDYT